MVIDSPKSSRLNLKASILEEEKNRRSLLFIAASPEGISDFDRVIKRVSDENKYSVNLHRVLFFLGNKAAR